MTRAPKDAGFTLLETLVALAVLASGAVGLMSVVEDHARRVGGMEDRIAMRWVAENALAARALGIPEDPAWRRMLGSAFAVTTEARGLPDSGRQQYEVRVTAAEPGPGGPVVTLRGYTLAREDDR